MTGMSGRQLMSVEICIAIAAGLVAWGLATPHIIGHDDGIYLSTAKAIAEGQSYRLVNLPHWLWQTKYPPLYSILLASTFGFAQPVPEGIWIFKILNAVVLAGLVVATVALARRLTPLSTGHTLILAMLVGTAPGLVSFVDLLGSDLLFTLLGVLLSVAVHQFCVTPTARGAVVAGLLAGLCALTRSVGVALCLAIVAFLAARRQWRHMAWAAGGVFVAAGPWWLWRALHHNGSAGALEQYYVTYEPSLWPRLATDPAVAVGITANLATYVQQMPVVFAWPTLWVAVPVLVTAVTGFVLLPKEFRRWLMWLAGAYALAVLGHPYSVGRYLVPAVPFVLLFVVAGGGQRSPLVRIGGRRLSVAVALGVPLLILSVHGIWLRHYQVASRDYPHAAFGRPLGFAWGPLIETFQWLGQHTAPDAIVATPNDPPLFVYTGRRAIRAWLHDIDAFAAGNPRPTEELERQAVEVQVEFDRLGVTYLVTAPTMDDGEGHHGRHTLDALVRHTETWERVYSSSDGKHVVYRRRPVAQGTLPLAARDTQRE